MSQNIDDTIESDRLAKRRLRGLHRRIDCEIRYHSTKSSSERTIRELIHQIAKEFGAVKAAKTVMRFKLHKYNLKF